MREASKAILRRLADSRFANRYFVGEGIDIGCGPDPVSLYAELFPRMGAVRPWDMPDGDAQLLQGVADESFDFVHSSHCLEHMRDPREALKNWYRVLKPGGYLVITVPDEDLYEQGVFPSRFNTDHKWTFTLYKQASWSSKSINVLELFKVLDMPQVLKVELLDASYRYQLPPIDQTLTPIGECAIEFIIRKPTLRERQEKGRLPDKTKPMTKTDFTRLTGIRVA